MSIPHHRPAHRALRLSAWLGLILLLVPALPARADTWWVCVLVADATRLSCLADVLPEAEAAAPTPATAPAAPGLLAATTLTPTAATATATATATSPSPATPTTALAPLDARRRLEVDLLGPAADLAFVEQLAQATLCGRTPRCRAWLAHPGARPAPAPW
jgi:hypothetical protein